MMAGDIRVGDHVHGYGRVTSVEPSADGKRVHLWFGADSLTCGVGRDLSVTRDDDDDERSYRMYL